MRTTTPSLISAPNAEKQKQMTKKNPKKLRRNVLSQTPIKQTREKALAHLETLMKNSTASA